MVKGDEVYLIDSTTMRTSFVNELITMQRFFMHVQCGSGKQCMDPSFGLIFL